MIAQEQLDKWRGLEDDLEGIIFATFIDEEANKIREAHRALTSLLDEVERLRKELETIERNKQAHTEGWQARIAGHEQNQNPYRWNNEEYRQWQRGWMDNWVVSRYHLYSRLWQWAKNTMQGRINRFKWLFEDKS